MIAVSHADPIKAAVATALGVHLDLFQRIDISPCSMTVIAYGDEGPFVHCVNRTGVVTDGRELRVHAMLDVITRRHRRRRRAGACSCCRCSAGGRHRHAEAREATGGGARPTALDANASRTCRSSATCPSDSSCEQPLEVALGRRRDGPRLPRHARPSRARRRRERCRSTKNERTRPSRRRRFRAPAHPRARAQRSLLAAHRASSRAGRPPCPLVRPPARSRQATRVRGQNGKHRSRTLTVLADGEIVVEGRMPWSSNADAARRP